MQPTIQFLFLLLYEWEWGMGNKGRNMINFQKMSTSTCLKYLTPPSSFSYPGNNSIFSIYH